jgi:hypothetical protein
MAILPIGELGLGNEFYDDNNASSLGRISGPLLKSNLERNGIDLAFETDLLYFDVANQRIGINRDNPQYDLDVNNEIRTTKLDIREQATIGNVLISSPNTFSTLIGPLEVQADLDSTFFHDTLETSDLRVDQNRITSFLNSDVIFSPSGSGTVELQKSTQIIGNVTVSRDITIDGNLVAEGDITVGDSSIDTVNISTDLTLSIIPDQHNVYDLGKATNRWNTIESDGWLEIVTLIPEAVSVNDRVEINGVNNKISTIQDNEDIVLLPDTEVTVIEKTQWQDNTITNLNNTALILAGTGRGYLSLEGTNGFVMPSGIGSDRRLSPEIGETRWNTELDYLECFNGEGWVVAIGAGTEITPTLMEDLSYVWNLILG